MKPGTLVIVHSLYPGVVMSVKPDGRLLVQYADWTHTVTEIVKPEDVRPRI